MRSGSPGEWLWGPEAMRWRRVFSGRADQVRSARDFATLLFSGTGREDDVATVVAELAANAVRHSRSGLQHGWFGLEITLARVAYIAVTDQGGGSVPLVRTECAADELAESGRGLLMVSQLALATGIHGSPRMGFTVWADMDLRCTDRQVSLAS
ncbi:ATP-binding protein [Spirillospora albida]|uniref:ATP-binding protein n=1 Tax=Spirillospora albida TaxID=58123 RepID=UPI000691DE67|nr:ATP-binding protein [Spirillospora albida]